MVRLKQVLNVIDFVAQITPAILMIGLGILIIIGGATGMLWL
jgi:hypothetical protein